MASLNLRGTWIKGDVYTPTLGTDSASTPAHGMRRRAASRHVYQVSTSTPTTFTRPRALPLPRSFAATGRTEPVEVLRLEDLMPDLGESSFTSSSVSDGGVMLIGHHDRPHVAISANDTSGEGV